MKILVLADSHGDVAPMIKAVKTENPDLIVHLGDHYDDALELRKHTSVQIRIVKGNGDFNPEAQENDLFEVEKVKIFACHGHKFNVKFDMLPLAFAGKSAGADIALFGHSHIDFDEIVNGIHLFNPGSIGRSPTPSYAVLTVNDGKYQFETIFI